MNQTNGSKQYGFVGLGQMGAPMARHLVPYGLTIYDTRPEAMKPLVEAGARGVASVAEVAACSSVVSIMVRDDGQVNQVAAEVLTAAAPGTVLAIHSTISPQTAINLAAEAEPFGIHIVDAPVSGGFMGADAGTLAVMVGGSDEAFATCTEPFQTWAELVLHMGPVGAGTRTKLARNLLHFVAFAAAAEAQRLAEASGVSLRKLGRIVRHTDAITGGPGAIMLRPTTQPLPSDDPLRAIMRHVQALGEKDLSLAIDLATELDVDTPLARIALNRLASGLGLTTNPQEPDSLREGEV